jgi:hypothetical protein
LGEGSVKGRGVGDWMGWAVLSDLFDKPGDGVARPSNTTVSVTHTSNP